MRYIKLPWIAGHWLNKAFLWHVPVAIKRLKMHSLHNLSFNPARLHQFLHGLPALWLDWMVKVQQELWRWYSASAPGWSAAWLQLTKIGGFTLKASHISHMSALLWKPCKRPTCPGTCNAGQHSVPQTDLAKKCASKLVFRWLEHRFHVFLASPFSSLTWRTSSCSCFLVVFLPQSLHWLHGLRSLESLNLLTRVTATLKVSVWCNNWFRNIRNLFYLHSPKLGHWKILKPGDVWFKT